MPVIYDICPKKNKIPKFCMIFARKENVRIFHDIFPKNIFPKIEAGDVSLPPLLPHLLRLCSRLLGHHHPCGLSTM